MTRVLFASLVSQSENLGDLVIRRNAIVYGFPNQPVLALASRMPTEYLESFELPLGSRYIQSSVHFQALFIKELLRFKADFLIAPGPVVLTGKVASLFKAIVVTANCFLVRLSGGKVWSVGRSYRGENRLAGWLERVQNRISSKYYVRDAESKLVLGSKVRVKPDMAFADDFVLGGGDKKYIAVSLRNYCEDSFAELQELVRVARQESLDVILVTQVKFDEYIHEDLSKRLGVGHIGWGDRSHVQQLQMVSNAYSKSVAIVSNRLHALVFGLRYGAVAVPFESAKNPKLKATLEGWVPLADWADIVNDSNHFFELLPQMRQESRASWCRARRELLSFLNE